MKVGHNYYRQFGTTNFSAHTGILFSNTINGIQLRGHPSITDIYYMMGSYENPNCPSNHFNGSFITWWYMDSNYLGSEWDGWSWMVIWLQPDPLYVSVAQVSGPPSPTAQSADIQGSTDLVQIHLHPSWRSGRLCSCSVWWYYVGSCKLHSQWGERMVLFSSPPLSLIHQ